MVVPCSVGSSCCGRIAKAWNFLRSAFNDISYLLSGKTWIHRKNQGYQSRYVRTCHRRTVHRPCTVGWDGRKNIASWRYYVKLGSVARKARTRSCRGNRTYGQDIVCKSTWVVHYRTAASKVSCRKNNYCSFASSSVCQRIKDGAF
ncbi:hypothetical protein D9M70_592550 [compost metagenome]